MKKAIDNDSQTFKYYIKPIVYDQANRMLIFDALAPTLKKRRQNPISLMLYYASLYATYHYFPAA